LRPLQVNHRTHRKVMIVDEKVAFTGGVGIADEWKGDARNEREWRDDREPGHGDQGDTARSEANAQVPPALGKLLGILTRASGARKILEIGTLGGYSGIWMARALPDGGRLISLDVNAHHADVARRSFERAGLADRVEVRVGPALETLPTLQAEAPFDLVYIDADKDNYSGYLDWAIRLFASRHPDHRRQRAARRRHHHPGGRRRRSEGHQCLQPAGCRAPPA